MAGPKYRIDHFGEGGTKDSAFLKAKKAARKGRNGFFYPLSRWRYHANQELFIPCGYGCIFFHEFSFQFRLPEILRNTNHDLHDLNGNFCVSIQGWAEVGR
jgi:hypothetical protein